MSQKINPLINKLGIIQLWNYQGIKYGKNFINYTKFIQPCIHIFNYINRFCLNNNLLIENIIIIQRINRITIDVFVVPLKELNIIKIKKLFLNTIFNWVNSSIKLSLYKNINIGNTSFFISNYVNYLFVQKLNSPKKILQFIYNILKFQSKKKVIKYTIYGIKIVELKGFKIEISGCFEASRSQMSKTIKCNFGIIPLSKLNGYIDYSTDTFFTKFGSCGLKIWLFYEFKRS